MSPAITVSAVGVLLSVALAAAALVRNRGSFAHRAFAGGLAALATEQALAVASVDSVSAADALAWARLRLVATAFVPGAWLLFSLTFARRDPRQFLSQKARLVAVWVLTLGLAGPLGGALFIGAGWRADGWWLTLGWAGLALHLAVVLGLSLSLAELERTLRASSGSMRWQIKFVVLGLGALFATRIYTASQALVFRSVDTSLHVVDSIGLVVGLAIVAAGLARTRLLDFDVYLSPTALYRSVTALLVGIYLLSVGLIAQVFRSVGGSQALPLAAFLVLLALVGLAVPLFSDNLRRSARRFITRNLRRPYYDYRREWMAFTDRTSAMVDLNALCAAVARVVSETVGAPSVSLWLHEEGKSTPALAGSTAFTANQARELLEAAPGNETLFRALCARPEPLDLHGPDSPSGASPAAGYLHEARYCVALAVGREELGIMTLGERGGGHALSEEDLDLVRTLARQAAASISNVRLANRLSKAKEMEAFQHLSAFFIHDLKNLASRLSLTLQNAPTHLDDPEFRRDMLSTMSLTVAEIDDTCSRLWPLSGGLELRRQEADLNELVASTLRGLNGAITASLTQDLHELPAARVDPEQIQKVLVNLVLNASEAAGGAGEVRVGTARGEGCVFVSVTDNGCGMSREFMERSLFEPFCTTKRQGLGIGLFHARKIVEAHQGRIEVESAEGAGSTFRVVLPAGA